MEGKDRAQSVGSTISQGPTPSVISAPSRRFSVSSSITSRTRKTSKIELVNMPGGVMLLEVDERDDDAVSILSRRDSLSGARSVGGITAVPDTAEVDRQIKIEMAHHSPSVGGAPKKDSAEEAEEGESDSLNAESRKDGPGSTGSFGISDVLNHLHLALASPAFFRIPALANKWSTDDGSGFLFAYCITLVVIAMPICVLEQTMAQFSSLGIVTIFRCLPLLTGVGIGMVACCSILMLYTSTVFTWSTRYLFDCMHSDIPWATCGMNRSNCTEDFNQTNLNQAYLPNEMYFLYNVLGLLNTEKGSSFSMSLVFIQIFLWLAVAFLVSLRETWQRGIFSKFMGLLFVSLLLAFAVIGLSGEGSGDAIGDVFILDVTKLKEPDIWLDALGQGLWTLGPTLGILISRASYRRFRERVRLDVYTAVAVNIILVVLLHLAFFPYLSLPAEAKRGLLDPGYFFIISSYVVTVMSVPQLAGAVLYLCACKALLDHTKMLASTVTVSINDLLPIRWRSGGRRLLFEFLVCIGGFLGSLLFVAKDGLLYLDAVDAYLPWVCGITLGLLEVSGFAYLYGTKNIVHHLITMVERKVYIFPYIWKFVLAPVLLGLLVWAGVVGVEGPMSWDWDYPNTKNEEVYSATGLALAMVPICLCFVSTLVIICSYRKSPRSLLVPRETWGPALLQHRALYTTGIIKAHSRRPYLIVNANYDLLEDPPKSWIPYGFYLVPSKSLPAYLLEAVAEENIAKDGLVRYLKAVFSNSQVLSDWTTDTEELISRENASDIPDYYHSVTSLEARTRKTASVSSGILLQPAVLFGNEAKIQKQIPPSDGSYSNPFFANNFDSLNE